MDQTAEDGMRDGTRELIDRLCQDEGEMTYTELEEEIDRLNSRVEYYNCQQPIGE